MRLSTLALLPALLVACSGSGSSDSPSRTAPATTELLVDTQAEPPTQATGWSISGTVASIALESPTGGLTGNLVSGNPELTLVSPDAAASGLSLDGIPPGQYVTAHVMFVPGTLTATDPDGNEGGIVMPEPQLRIPFAAPLVAPAASGGWFVIRHGSLTLTPRAGGDYFWRPELTASVQDLQPLYDVTVEIVEVQANDLSATATVPALGDRVVELLFRSAASLSIDDDDVTAAAFLAELETGDRIVLHDALFERVDRVWVLSASFDAPVGTQKAVGNKNDVSGVIGRLDTNNEVLQLRVRSVHKAGSGFPATRPLELRVTTDRKTKIKWVPRAGRHTGHLPFSALRQGMIVDVEWHGAPGANNTVVAHKIDIRSGGRAMRESLAGRAQRIDTTNNEIVLGPRARTSTVWRRYQTVTIELEPDAILVQQTVDGIRLIDLSDISPGATLWMLATPVRADRLRASLVLALRN